MNQYLLYVSSVADRRVPSWGSGLYNHGIVVQALRTLPEALQYNKVYPALLIALEIDCVETVAAEARAALTDAPAHPPVIGIMAARPEPRDLACLAEAGLVDVLGEEDPEPFILWRLELLRRLGELAHFEQSRMDVGELAKKTRVILHDLSQPLSAIQGRLQLLASSCPAEDPNAQTYRDLVRLSLDLTHQLMSIQQLHRQYS